MKKDNHFFELYCKDAKKMEILGKPVTLTVTKDKVLKEPQL